MCGRLYIYMTKTLAAKVLTIFLVLIRTTYFKHHITLQTILYKKPTDCQNYLHSKADHPYALKMSIAYSHAFCIKRICSIATEYKKHSKALENALVNKTYQRHSVRRKIEKTALKERENFLNKPTEESKQIFPIAIT